MYKIDDEENVLLLELFKWQIFSSGQFIDKSYSRIDQCEKIQKSILEVSNPTAFKELAAFF